jgi:hypothetical protein
MFYLIFFNFYFQMCKKNSPGKCYGGETDKTTISTVESIEEISNHGDRVDPVISAGISVGTGPGVNIQYFNTRSRSNAGSSRSSREIPIIVHYSQVNLSFTLLKKNVI